MVTVRSLRLDAITKGQQTNEDSISFVESSESGLAKDSTCVSISSKLDLVTTKPKTGSLTQGVAVVEVSGTAVSLPSKALSGGVLLQWIGPGPIYIGNSTVQNNFTSPWLSENGITALEVSNLSDLSGLYINSDQDNAKVAWLAV